MAQQPQHTPKALESESTKKRLDLYPTPIDTSGLNIEFDLEFENEESEVHREKVEKKEKQFVHDMTNPFYQQQQRILNQIEGKRRQCAIDNIKRNVKYDLSFTYFAKLQKKTNIC